MIRYFFPKAFRDAESFLGSCFNCNDLRNLDESFVSMLYFSNGHSLSHKPTIPTISMLLMPRLKYNTMQPSQQTALNQDSPDGHNEGKHGLGVPGRQLWHREDGEREDEVEKVEGGQADQQLVEVAPHLRTGEHKDRQHVA